MNRRTLFYAVAIGLCTAVQSPAQLHDAEFSYFEPLAGFDDVVSSTTSDGWRFSYDRLYWSAHAERPTIGSESAIVRHMEIYGPGGIANRIPVDGNGDTIEDTPIPLGVNPITRPLLSNSLNEVFPRAAFEMGDRFEFGRQVDGGGWMVSFTTPFDITQNASFGIGFTGQDSRPGGLLPSDNDDNGTIAVNGDEDLTNDITLPTQFAANPLGSVVILFDYAPGFMDGFIDIRDGVDVFPADADGDGFLDGDLIADDVNGNGVFGADLAANVIDFGDLVELPTSFNRVDVRSTLETTDMQLMRSKPIRNIRSGMGLSFLYGLRYFRLKDEFFVAGHGGVLGESSWDTEIRNNLFGPQVGARWTRSCGKWGFAVDGRAFMAVNWEDWEQDVSLGEDLLPSAFNHPLYFSPTVAHHGQRKYEFAPMGELRVTSSYQLTKGVALNLGFNGMYVDGVRRAATHVRYRLPDMGFVNGRREHVFLTGANIGVTFVH